MPESTDKNSIDLKKIRLMNDEDILTKPEFTDAFKKVVDLVLNLKKEVSEAISKMEEIYSGSFNKLSNDNSLTLTDLRKQVDGLFVEDRVKKIDGDTKMSFTNLKNEFNRIVDQKLKDVDFKVEQRAKPGPMGMRGEQGRPPTREELKSVFNDLFDDFKNTWKTEMQNTLSANRRVNSAPHNLVQYFNATSQADGFNKIFTGLPIARHYPMIFLKGQNPVTLLADVDYTIGRGSITLDNSIEPPTTGVGIYIQYIK